MISFHRFYPADLRAVVAGAVRRLPVRVELALTGPVGRQSGMVVNLVDIDHDARTLLGEFEKRDFAAPEAALAWLRDRWIQAGEKRGLRADSVGLKGRFGELRFGWDRAGGRRTEWALGRFAVNPATGASGRIFAVAEDRAAARAALTQLAAQKRLDLAGLAEQRWPAGVFAVGFRDRKSRRETRLEL